MRDDSDRTAATSATRDGDRPMHEPDTQYEQGRVDEAREREGRFSRDPERAEDPTRSGPTQR